MRRTAPLHAQPQSVPKQVRIVTCCALCLYEHRGALLEWDKDAYRQGWLKKTRERAIDGTQKTECREIGGAVLSYFNLCGCPQGMRCTNQRQARRSLPAMAYQPSHEHRAPPQISKPPKEHRQSAKRQSRTENRLMLG